MDPKEHEQPNSEPSLWAQYVEEVRGGVTKYIEYPWGFIAYSFPDFAPDCIYAEEVYVIKSERRNGRSMQLLKLTEDVGRRSGKIAVLGIVRMTSKSSHYTLKGHLDSGFIAIGTETNAVWLRKPIPPEA